LFTHSYIVHNCEFLLSFPLTNEYLVVQMSWNGGSNRFCQDFDIS